MECAYFTRGECHSCTLIEQPYAEQLAGKQQHVAAVLSEHPGLTWLPPVASAQEGFRNKAKMAVTGTAAGPRLGLLDADIRGCPLHTPGIRASMDPLAEFIGLAGLTPYDLATRRGELKYLLVTESPVGELMVRFVLRSEEALARIRKHLPALRDALPSLAVASVNLQPEHKAILEGEREILLTGQESLTMSVNGIDLHLRPQSFFQTNTEMAAALYHQAAEWAGPARSVWDLYCGVGGFALHLARAADGTERDVLGIEASAEAIASARLSAREAGLTRARFEVGDATTHTRAERPDLIVVNPPRRGIGEDLAGWLDGSGAEAVIYSSCNALTLARDLAAMPSYDVMAGRLLDMFPNTGHYEVIVRLARR